MERGSIIRAGDKGSLSMEVLAGERESLGFDFKLFGKFVFGNDRLPCVYVY